MCNNQPVEGKTKVRSAGKVHAFRLNYVSPVRWGARQSGLERELREVITVGCAPVCCNLLLAAVIVGTLHMS